MKRTVGLDLGSNSIGWSLILKDDNNAPIEIVAAGSRIIASEKERKDFEAGTSTSKAAERRQKRGIRRLNHRYKLRRENLKKALSLLGVPMDFIGLMPRTKEETITALEIYGLRAKASSEALTLEEFGRVLFHLNQRRGYKSNRADGGESDEEKTDDSTVWKRATIKSVTPTGEWIKDRKEYEVVLDDGTSGKTTSYLFEKMVGKEKLIAVKTIVLKSGEVKTALTMPKPDDWGMRLATIDREMEETGLHPGAYFFDRITDNPDFRIRQNLVYRHRYIAEFNALWDEQAKHHPVLGDEKAKAAIIKAVLPSDSPQMEFWMEKPLKTFFRDYIIYYQRDLKTKKSSIGGCRFESRMINGTWRPVAAAVISHPLYQEFRIWQTVNNLKYKDGKEDEHFLSEAQCEKLYEALSKTGKLEVAKLPKLLGLPKETEFKAAGKELLGNETKTKLEKAFKKADLPMERYVPDLDAMEKLWHLLYSLKDEHIPGALERQFGIAPEISKPIAITSFKKERGSLSIAAVRKLLPIMRHGKYFGLSALHKDVAQRIDNILDGIFQDDLEADLRQKFAAFTTPTDFRGLPYYQAATLVYDQHTAKAADSFWTSPDEIEILPSGSLRNPTVEQLLNETLHLLQDIWRTYGKPDEVRVELGRELRQNKAEREKAIKSIEDRTKDNKRIEDRLKADFSMFKHTDPKQKDILRFRLWEESGGRCIYSGTNIERTDIFSGATDIDHIIPKERYFDDSQANKILVYRSENAAKGKAGNNLTAYEYMKGKSTAEWERYENEVKKRFRGKKRFNLLTDKIPEEIPEIKMVTTRYVTKRIMQELQKVKDCAVWASIGSITDYLKNDWGLNDVFKEVLLERYRRLEDITGAKLVERKNESNGRHYWDIKDWSKRIDHRHHALDAITIALTTQSMVQRLNNLNQTDRVGVRQKTAWHFDPPHPQLKQLVKDALEKIVVSHRNRKRLLTPSPSYYMARDPETKKLKLNKQVKGKAQSVRSALHDEQPYGQIKVYEKTPIKKAFAMVADLAMPWQKELVQARLDAYDGDAAKALASLKKAPLLKPNGKPLEEVTIFKTKYIKNRDLGVGITRNQLEEIADHGLRKELLAHLDAFGGDPKKAFTEENLAIFNEGRKKPVYSVRSTAEGSYERMQRKHDPNQKLFIQKGNNYCFVIYENIENGQREYDVIPFYDAAQLKADKMDIVPSKEGFRHFTLTHNDLVYVPEPGENTKAIDWERDLKLLSKRIYKVVKFSGKQFYFVPQNFATVFENEFIHKNPNNCSEFSMDKERLSIKAHCIKLKIDRLGRINPA